MQREVRGPAPLRAAERSGGNRTALLAPADVDRYVGQRIRERRRELRLSMVALADRLGITYQQMQKYESAKNRISASRLMDLATLMAVPVEYFFEGLPEAGSDDDDVLDVAAPEYRELLDAFAAIRHEPTRRRLATLIKFVSR